MPLSSLPPSHDVVSFSIRFDALSLPRQLQDSAAAAASLPAAMPTLPSETLLATLRKCGSGELADTFVSLEAQGKEVRVEVHVPTPTGDDVVRAVGSDQECFTPELREELKYFVELSSPPVLSKVIEPAPSPPPPAPPSPMPPGGHLPPTTPPLRWAWPAARWMKLRAKPGLTSAAT